MTAPHEAAPVDDAPPPPARTPVGRRRLLTALAVLCALLVLAAVVLGVLLRGYAQEDDARGDALRAARQSALNLTSIDYRDFDAAVDRVLEGATGDFSEEFKGNATNLEKLLTDNQVRSEGKVVDAGLVRADGSSATALVVVDSTVRNTEVPDGRVNTYRMQIEVEKVDGRWLTSTLRFVG